jgi:hypothetical protein
MAKREISLTPDQVGELMAPIMGAVLAMPPDQAQYWIGRKTKLTAELTKLLGGGQVFASRAAEILGGGKVVTIDQAREAREIDKVALSVYDTRIRYFEATLRACAIQNRDSGADWRLVYCFGFSLRELREQIGIDPSHQPCCYNNDWWLKAQEDEWAAWKAEPGYRLISFNGIFPRSSWDAQEHVLKTLGAQFYRVEESVLAEAITTIFQATGKRLLQDWYHWGPSLASFGDRSRVCVGVFGQSGWGVEGVQQEVGHSPNHRVCVARKFDIPE